MLERTWKAVAAAALVIPAGIATANVTDRGVVVSGTYGDTMQTVTISMADLDLRQDPNVGRAQMRIRHAAERVCDKASAKKLYEKRDFLRCYEPAISGAHAELDALVTAVRAS
ncbi:MAG: UrcA family protein [Pseudomonadota bacterium]|jgi:UrcA family protein